MSVPIKIDINVYMVKKINKIQKSCSFQNNRIKNNPKQSKHTLKVVIHINKESYQTTKNYNIHQKLEVKTKSNLSLVLYISFFPWSLGHEAAIRGSLGSGLDGVQHLADVSLLLLQQVL